MKTTTVLNLVQTAQYEDFASEYKKLLGYEKNTEFYAPHADTKTLLDYLNNKLGFEIEESYGIFMGDSNGCELDGNTIFSFKHEEQIKDVLFVNFDKNTRSQFEIGEGAFIAGKYQSAAIVFDKASRVYDDPTENGYVWAIYSKKHQKYLKEFETFYELLIYLIQDRIDFFVED